MALEDAAPLPQVPTDPLGNPLPSALVQPSGVSALASPSETNEEPESGLAPPISGGATMGQRSQVLADLAKHTDAAVKANPTLATKPGGIWQAIVAGTMGAIGNLGDASAVGQVPSGGGALEGVTRTLNAERQRKAQEKQQQFENVQADTKNKAMIAESNVRMMHEQKLIHQMDETAINQSIEVGNRAVQKLKSNPSAAPVIAEGLTSDELQRYLASNKIDPTKETAYPTGRKPVGQNPDGTPVYRTTYTAMGLPQDVTLDPSKADDKKILDDFNKYSPRQDGGKWGSGGAQNLSGAQYNWMMQQVADGTAQSLNRDKTMLEQGMEKEKIDELKGFNMGSDWTNALATNKGDVIGARNSILSNPQLAQKYKNLDADITAHYPLFPKMYEDYQKKLELGITDFQKWNAKADEAKGDEAAAMAAAAQAKIDDQSTPEPLREAYKKKVIQLNKQSQASLSYDEKKKSNELAAETQADSGTMDELVDMALKYEQDPNQLFSKFKGLKAKQEFLAKIHRIDPSWSEGEYKARYNTKNDFRPQGKGGIAKSDLNTFALHTGDANSLIQTLRNTGSPLLNTPLNKFKQSVLGQPQFIAYRTAMAAAAENYINFLLANKAKHASDDQLAEQLKSDTISPAMAQGVMRQMANTIAIKAREFNKTYKDQMKTDIPELLDPNTVDVLKGFGVDPDTIMDTKKNIVTSSTGQSTAGNSAWGQQFGAKPR